MYKLINFLAFIGCIIWLLIERSTEPVVVLLLTIAGFFRDDIHGVIGKNILTLTPKAKLIRNLYASKYSFINSEFVNPRIIEDLIGWLSDSGAQIVAINVSESNKSNRYIGDIEINDTGNDYPVVTSTYDHGRFSYKYLGTSFTGMHLLQTWSNGGGSGVFCNIVLVTLSMDSAFEQNLNGGEKINRFVIKLIGVIPLGDRYQGDPSYKFGLLTIPACNGLATVRKSKSRMLVI